MKIKVEGTEIVLTNDTGVVVKKKKVRDPEFLTIALKNRSNTFKNKKAYTRKNKYKPNYGNF